MKKLNTLIFSALSTLLVICSSCSNDEPTPPPTSTDEDGLFIVNQGNFNYGNASLTFYSPDTDVAEQEVFFRANDAKLGDVAQSMTIQAATGWIVVNNSNVIFAIDIDTYKEKGRITDGISSPRYIYFVSDSKAYVTQLYDSRIAIVDPTRYAITGYIDLPDGATAEMIVGVGDYVYANCWSYNDKIVRIDPATDRIVGSVTTPIQPKAMTVDADGNVWAVTDGGYYGSPYGYDNPTLIRLNTSTFAIDRTFKMDLGANITTICTDGQRRQLYWICNDVYTMSISSTEFPTEPIISANGNWLNGMTVDPMRGDIYVADALDYMQPGRLLRYKSDGTLITTVPTGVIPGGFCWKK